MEERRSLIEDAQRIFAPICLFLSGASISLVRWCASSSPASAVSNGKKRRKELEPIAGKRVGLAAVAVTLFDKVKSNAAVSFSIMRLRTADVPNRKGPVTDWLFSRAILSLLVSLSSTCRCCGRKTFFHAKISLSLSLQKTETAAERWHRSLLLHNTRQEQAKKSHVNIFLKWSLIRPP